MKEKMKYIIIVFIICFIGCMAFGTNSYAYTEEQKQQAKAWLSAHGYSPDAGGAAAAYQDYLNGKFDEELGITREETTGSPQSAYEEEDEKSEKTTGEDKKSQANINSVWDFMEQNNGNGQSSTDDNVTTEATTEKTTEKVTEEPSTQIAYDEEAVEDDLEVEEDEEEASEALEQAKKKEKNKEAVIVVVLSVLAIILVFGVIILMKK